MYGRMYKCMLCLNLCIIEQNVLAGQERMLDPPGEELQL